MTLHSSMISLSIHVVSSHPHRGDMQQRSCMIRFGSHLVLSVFLIICVTLMIIGTFLRTVTPKRCSLPSHRILADGVDDEAALLNSMAPFLTFKAEAIHPRSFD
jgi:hypothetical protein